LTQWPDETRRTKDPPRSRTELLDLADEKTGEPRTEEDNSANGASQ